MSVYKIGDMYPPTMPHHIGHQTAVENISSHSIRIIQMKNHHKYIITQPLDPWRNRRNSVTEAAGCLR